MKNFATAVPNDSSPAARPDYSDQVNIFNAGTWGWVVHLIGAGGVNNAVGPLLAKMGVREIHIWDDDILEARNGPTEIAYSYRMVGQPKTTAMADAIRYQMGDQVHIIEHCERVTATTNLSGGVVICGVDSMAARQEIWQNVKPRFMDIPLFIDGRSAGEYMMVFAFRPADFAAAKDYEEDWLYDDSESMPQECGARNIGYIAAQFAADIGRIVTQFHRGLPVEFMTQHDFTREQNDD